MLLTLLILSEPQKLQQLRNRPVTCFSLKIPESETSDGAMQIAQRSLASVARRRYSGLFWYWRNAHPPPTNMTAS